MALNTNFNQSPYYDDYDEFKNYHRVLFRPGFAVQARELTQMQSILQNQIERYGNHVFTEGAIVTGCPITDSQVAFVKIRDDDTVGNPVIVEDKKGLTVTGGTTGMTATVRQVLDGTEVSQDKKTLYIAYTNSGTNNTTTSFSGGEILTFSDGTTAEVVPTVDIPTGAGLVYRVGDGIIYAKGHFVRHYDQSIVAGRYTTQPSVKVGFGVREVIVGSETDSSLLDPAQGSSNYSAPGADRLKLVTFLQVAPLSAIVPAGTSAQVAVVPVGNTSANAVTTNISTATAVQPANTVSATTQPVQAANGAIVSQPATTSLGVATPTPNFNTIATINQGVQQAQAVQSSYAQLGKTLAQNIFEINGDFTISPFVVNVKENLKDVDNQGRYSVADGGNANLVSVGIEDGIGFVNGFRYQFQQTASVYRDIDKGIDTEQVNQVSVSSNYGQYVLVRDVAGLFDSGSLPTISLRDAEANAIIGGTFDLTAAPGSEIGTATLRNFIHEDEDSNNPDGEFRVYLQDIQMTSGDFKDTRSVFIQDAAGTNKHALADLVLEANNAVIKEPSFNKLLFSYPFPAVKTIRDNNNSVQTTYLFKKTFNLINLDSNGRGTISTGAVDEVFTTTGALNNTQMDELFTIVATSTGYSTMSGTVTLSNGSDQVVGVSTDFTKLEPYQLIRVGSSDIVQILSIEDASNLTLTATHTGSSHNGESIYKVIQSGEILDMSSDGITGTRSINITSQTSASIDIEESLVAGLTCTVIANLQKSNAREAAKTLNTSYVIINPDIHSSGLSGPWGLGFSDVFSIENIYMSTDFNTTPSTSDGKVTSRYTFDNGQKAGYYDHGVLKLTRGQSTPTGQLLIELKYFEPDYTQGEGYFSVDSYPINDNQVSSTTIKTYQIPIFTDPASGRRVDLRNAIDIRPVKSNSATQTTTIGSATVNPSSAFGLGYQQPTNGQYMSIPNENIQADMVIYQGRIDKLMVDPSGIPLVKRGVPDINPTEPLDNGGMMTIAVLHIPPYPSLSPYVGKNSGRQDLAIRIQQINSRRYTMKDIGELEKRITHLEYYTSLNLLEKSAQELTITDAGGNDRFKNGIIVDAFTGHNVGAVTDADYAIAIDPERREARPSFVLSAIDFIHDEDDNDNTATRRCHDVLLDVENISATSGLIFKETVNGSASGASGTLFTVTGSDTLPVVFLESVSGTFSVGETITAATSGITARVTAIRTPEPGPLITIDYQHNDLAIQNVASTEFRISDAEFFDFIGEMRLTPNGDTWVDTSTKPDLQVNQAGNYDNWEVLSNAWGTSWGSWQTNFSGKLSSATTRLADSTVTRREGNHDNTYKIKNYNTKEVYGKQQSREGFVLKATPEVDVTNLGEKVVDTNVVPYMRQKLITVECSKLRPNTRVYPFFDDISVADYCRPAEKTTTNYQDGNLYLQYRREFTLTNVGNYGDSLVSDSNGNIVFEFLIPNNDDIRFRIGTKPLRVTDSSTNGTDNTTAAETVYSASGIHQTKQETVLSTRNADLKQVSVKDARTVVTDVKNIKSNTQADLLSSRYVPPPCRRGCFMEGTQISMEDGTTKSVELIKLGDRVKLGGGVFALGQFWINDLYEYRGIKVAGSHMVNHEGEWTRIRDIEESVQQNVGDGTVVYVFGCENRRIEINGIEFTDYFEVREQEAVQQIGETYFEKWEEFADELEKENERVVA